MDETNPNLEDLKPVVSDPEKYAQMMTEVKKSTAKNENLTQLKVRRVKIGLTGAQIVEVISKIL